MSPARPDTRMARNVRLYPWFRFVQNLVFWQAVWFLFFQDKLSAGAAILIYVLYDISTTALEVPSGYMSDRLGRRPTLILASISMALGSFLQFFGDTFIVFALAQILIGGGAAFASGTDSAMLYESLAADDRQDEVEHQEVVSWRYGFTALALSAVTGGLMAFYQIRLPFLATGLAAVAGVALAWQFYEPPHPDTGTKPITQFAAFKGYFREPVLLWLFGLSTLMYIFSHIPFIFGQPFILEALTTIGLAAEAPLVSGVTSGIMMLLSVLVSLVATRLRMWLGLAVLLLFAFGMQVALAGALAWSNAPFVIALLFLRMVPDSLSWPFIVARIQPLLSGDNRATYLSLQSFVGRLIFAATLYLASYGASDQSVMAYSEIRLVVGGYALAGLIAWITLWVTARNVPLDPPAK
jgi:MFS family permease